MKLLINFLLYGVVFVVVITIVRALHGSDLLAGGLGVLAASWVSNPTKITYGE